MALTQVQIIQSLAEAISWFEKELDWGVSPGDLGHLTGRIGELYVAMITRGQMALETNQRGYDVIGADNERISVKTFTTSSHMSFNLSTLELVDRVMVLRVNVDDDTGVSVEIVEDQLVGTFRELCRTTADKLVYSTRPRARQVRPIDDLQRSDEASFGEYQIIQYENGTITVSKSGEILPVAKPTLRSIAGDIGVDILNSNSRLKNTRQLGADVIKMLKARAGIG